MSHARQCDLWDATVCLSLELEDGGGAAEAIAARGQTIVVEEVGLAFEFDGAAMNGE